MTPKEGVLAEVNGWMHPEDFSTFLDNDLFWDELPPGRMGQGFVRICIRVLALGEEEDDTAT